MSWQWYLMRAANTTLAVGSPGTGVMDGTVFREVLNALKAETSEPGCDAIFNSTATQIEQNMLNRQQRWEKQAYPYGSEFGFDTTGQEEVVIWNMYFGNMTAAK
eukprot:UC1_evm1s305